jgi:hypothetical protein
MTADRLLDRLGITSIRIRDKRALVADVGAHLDPDLDVRAVHREIGWRPSLGQADGAASHLRNEGVGVGDLFLFFGLFRHAERLRSQRLRFVGSPAHILFGWLEVDQVWPVRSSFADQAPAWLARHPHVLNSSLYANNTLYIARSTLSTDPRLPGAGRFAFSERLRLSRYGHSVSHWCLPPAFRPRRLSFHGNPERWSDCEVGVHLDCVGRGQEFVAESNSDLEAWASNLIAAHAVDVPTDRTQDGY